MTLNAIQDRIIVRPVVPERVTKAGIIIPETTQEKPQIGEVVSVGKGLRTLDGTYIPPEIEVGQKVLFSKYGGTEIKVGEGVLEKEEDQIILREMDILAIVEDDGGEIII